MGAVKEYAIEFHNDCMELVWLLEKWEHVPKMAEALEAVKEEFVATFGTKEIFWK